MYFPYVRGRQYELLALRELVSADLLSNFIIPVVEPVRLSSTLFKTMEEFIANKQEMSIICNPAVGSFDSDMNDDEKGLNKQKFLELLKESAIIKGHIMKANSKKSIIEWEKRTGIERKDWIIVNNNRDFLEAYQNMFEACQPKYLLIPDEFRRRVRKNKVLLEDRFKKCERNVDYKKNTDEFFSEDHLYYTEEGFKGFGDYSIIGENYLESGFAPYAVALHIVYFASDKSLRVHHFVSDSNEDIQNPAKKFYEAVSKLAKWVEDNNIFITAGLAGFLEHYKQQTYPGLGSAKKLSLMHHLELVGKFLDKEM